MTTLIERFKTQAKFLKKDYDKGNKSAINLIRKYYHNPRVTLMNCQFVIAKENGFSNWSDLLDKTSGGLK